MKIGYLAMTRSILNDMGDNKQFAKDVAEAIKRYVHQDFSDMESEEDIEMNRQAIESGEGRIFATYNTCLGKIYIITEADRSATTILYPSEY